MHNATNLVFPKANLTYAGCWKKINSRFLLQLLFYKTANAIFTDAKYNDFYSKDPFLRFMIEDNSCINYLLIKIDIIDKV